MKHLVIALVLALGIQAYGYELGRNNQGTLLLILVDGDVVEAMRFDEPVFVIGPQTGKAVLKDVTFEFSFAVFWQGGEVVLEGIRVGVEPPKPFKPVVPAG